MCFLVSFPSLAFLNKDVPLSFCVIRRSSFQRKSPRVSYRDDQLSDPAGSNSEDVLRAQWNAALERAEEP